MRMMRVLLSGLVLVLPMGCSQDRPSAIAPDETVVRADAPPFAPTFLDRCWSPLRADDWLLRSRSFGTWRLCMTGPREPAGPYAVAYFDVDADRDVDLVDFAALQRHWHR